MNVNLPENAAGSGAKPPEGEAILCFDNNFVHVKLPENATTNV